MTPETHLFLAAVAIHRELLPVLAGLPDHRRLIRDAFGTSEGDLDFLHAKFEELKHADIVDVDAAAAFAWLPADAAPRASDMVGGCR
jgi:hypothetical protein